MRTALLFILLFFMSPPAATMPIVGAEEQEIQCNDKLCLVPRPLLVQLVHQASLAEHYAEMCGWAK